MSDESLRSLARSLETGGETATRIHYALALERAGRCDDALDVLVAACGDPLIRRELARFPAWSQTGADAGRSRFLDVAPIRREPRLRWTSPEGTAETGTWRLLASPFGVACAGPNQSTVVLDPDTGEVRRRIGLLEPCALAGDVLLGKRNTKIRSYELETGTMLHEIGTETLNFDVLLAGEVLVTASPSRVQAFALPEGGTAPVLLWQYLARRTNRKGRFGNAVSTGKQVLVPQRWDVVVLDLHTGALETRVPGNFVVADPAGFLVFEDSKVVMRGPDGRVVWSREGQGVHPLAVAPDVIVAHVPETGAALLDRATGKIVKRLVEWCDRALVLRDVVYVLGENDRGDRLWAFSTGGAALWELALGDLVGEVGALAASARRIFGLTRRGRVFCLEGAGA